MISLFKKDKLADLFVLAIAIALAPSGFAQSQSVTSYSYKTNNNIEWQEHSDEVGHWIVDASKPGADIPHLGRSLFDLIISEGSNESVSKQIPFPFSRLVNKIRSYMTPSDDSIKQVRIPMGRSLRREITAPDYFHSPRLVIATDSGPRSTEDNAGLNLRGRLFLGYQEKSNMLEIISYNPWQGRFEFQEVRDYGENLSPKITYANRTLCLSCHQNAGPIFSKEPWLETDSNKNIRVRLAQPSSTSNVKTEYLPRFDDVWALDYATDRANYFASSQFIWRNACEAGGEFSIQHAVRCRAGMFKAILQYHLLDYVDQNTESYREWFFPIILDNWQRKWPAGLVIATADISDRNPFANSISSTQDPLNPRPPRAKWKKPSPHLLTGIIYQTADFITEKDIFEIDQFLKANAVENNQPTKQYASDCTLKRTANIGAQQHLEFTCQQTHTPTELNFTAKGAFIVENGHIIDGNIDTLNIPSLSSSLRFLDFANAKIITDGKIYRASIPVNKYETHIGARLFNGVLIRQLNFQWPVTLNEFGTVSDQPSSLVTVDDIGPLYAAIDGMIEETIAGESDAFSAKPFRRHTLIKSLHQHMGMPTLQWQQDQLQEILAKRTTANIDSSQNLSTFYRHCGSCHSTSGKFPPGFLAGTSSDVNQQLHQCATKILLRLNLWKTKPEDRIISPMPPSSWLSIIGMNEAHWQNSTDLSQMQQVAENLLSSHKPLPPQLSKPSALCL